MLPFIVDSLDSHVSLRAVNGRDDKAVGYGLACAERLTVLNGIMRIGAHQFSMALRKVVQIQMSLSLSRWYEGFRVLESSGGGWADGRGMRGTSNEYILYVRSTF